VSGGFSALFIRRPVATILLTIGVALAGALAYRQLPVSPLPQVDFATIVIQANMPGASPDNMATNVAAPLERHLGQIADVTEMSSQSSLGNTRITVQFGLDRDIDGAARDVEAAINAARADLPTSLKQNPSYHKVNPADAPIMVLALTSTTRPAGQLYDAASNILQQRLSQLTGIGEVDVTGSALPAVRVELNPTALYHYGIGLEDVRAALASANANSPKGQIEDGDFNYQIYANDQASEAEQYRDLVIAYRNNAAVRLADVADVENSVEDLRNAGLANGKPAIGIVLSRQPGANIIEAVDNVKAELPRLIAALPGDVNLSVVVDRSITIRGSLNDTIKTLITSVVLVILVVFVFLRDVRASAVPSVAVPVSIVGSFAAMYVLGFSLNNLSLMALTISTGFVVDDAIVVLENVSRHLEMGKSRVQAAIAGAREVGFTVVSISLSLVAVFLPLLLMGGLVGRLFKEFTVTLSMAVLISMVVSLTTTPMMCALILPRHAKTEHGRLYLFTEQVFDAMLGFYRVTLEIALRHRFITLAVFFATIWLNVQLFRDARYSLFPVQDTGLMIGSIQGDQSISFQAMKKKLAQLQAIVQDDPAVATVVGVTGGRQVNSGFVYISLKPFAERKINADGVVSRLRGKLARVAGARLFLVAVSDLRTGGRQSNATYQYTLLSDDTAELYTWAPRLTQALSNSDVLKDVNSDQQQGGLEADVAIDRPTSKRVGLTVGAIDNTLYDAYGQRQVSTIYNALNQYHVVMEVAPRYWQNPESLGGVYVSTSGANPSGTQSTNIGAAGFSASTSAAASNAAETLAADSARNLATNALAASGHSAASAGSAVTTAQETMVPLPATAEFHLGHTALGVNHQGQFAAATISFNLAEGKALSDVQKAIADAVAAIGMPSTVRGAFSGTALASQQAQSGQLLLIGAALLTVYLVLGILYESYIHPITIISTLPSASVGALIALQLFNTEVTIIAFIGIILLIGIVKKNAIMMIDFALEAERNGLDSAEAIRQACLMRFRPIMMTTMAALFGALPLAFGTGEGSELRHPLGITIVGGLLVSQALTLYTTPVVFLFLDRIGKSTGRLWRRFYLGERGAAAA
jgi:multidrug efflux pump